MLKTDSSAAKGILTRRGLNKNTRHISTRYLWIQDRVARKDLVIDKVSTHDQLADILTKPSKQQDIARIAHECGLEFREGISSKQKQLC